MGHGASFDPFETYANWARNSASRVKADPKVWRITFCKHRLSNKTINLLSLKRHRKLNNRKDI
jgi:hypothetical protein